MMLHSGSRNIGNVSGSDPKSTAAAHIWLLRAALACRFQRPATQCFRGLSVYVQVTAQHYDKVAAKQRGSYADPNCNIPAKCF